MKKKRSVLDAFLFVLNSIVAILLLLCYVLPFISPKQAPVLAVFSLSFPIIYFLNILFLIYWVVKLKRHFLLSTTVLLIGFMYLDNLYKFSGKSVLLNDDIKVMSYNVRLFNRYNWKNDKTIAKQMDSFIDNKSPDIIAFQEYYQSNDITLNYPYKYVETRSKTSKSGQAIYSKFPIINKGSLNLPKTTNNIIFTDMLVNKDTLRVYNIHLESLRLKTDEENFGEKDSKKLIGRMKQSFKKQVEQTEMFLEHEKQWKGKKIICGDFNNTAFSWMYHQISKDKKDAFETAGKGLGKSFDYFFPLRIDFILTDEETEINNYKTYYVKYSDHFPILARINLN